MWHLSGNGLTRNLSRNIRQQSSQLAEPLWTDPGIKRRSCVCELIITSKKKKKAQAGCDWWNILQNPRKRGKSRRHGIVTGLQSFRCSTNYHVRSANMLVTQPVVRSLKTKQNKKIVTGRKPAMSNHHFRGGGCSSCGRASYRHDVDTGSIPRGRQGIFLPESTFSADSLTVSVHPRVQSHAFTSVRTIKIP